LATLWAHHKHTKTKIALTMGDHTWDNLTHADETLNISDS